jgi:hypothetical protein
MKHGTLFSRVLGFVARHLGSQMRLRAGRFVVGSRTNYRHFADKNHDRMSADYAATFRANYEECKAQAALAVVPSSKAQWLVFAQEWLGQAEAAEVAQRRKGG